MDNDFAISVIGIFTGAIWTGYIVYGKNQKKIVAALCGVWLCFYSYFFDQTWALVAVWGLLTAIPFFLRI